ncbi:MAG: 2OG-Fe(II) oxygenase [Gemmatimonadetes bacterium]|nr:2OG-Fe(II) oxygenase [Gemmatimonadota bacterium]
MTLSVAGGAWCAAGGCGRAFLYRKLGKKRSEPNATGRRGREFCPQGRVEHAQLGFFDAGPVLPGGFRYRAEAITPEHERELVAGIRALPLREFDFHGHTGKRRIVSYGWRYDFTARRLDPVDDIPSLLLPLRDVAAAFAGVAPASLQQALVTEYESGAGIGWHRDKPQFGDVIGVSLASPCTFRLRRKRGDGTWERVNIEAAARSAYLMRGPSRDEWEHSIPGVDALRYSVTFRNFLGTPTG